LDCLFLGSTLDQFADPEDHAEEDNDYKVDKECGAEGLWELQRLAPVSYTERKK
jgi:hypothetical protein